MILAWSKKVCEIQSHQIVQFVESVKTGLNLPKRGGS